MAFATCVYCSRPVEVPGDNVQVVPNGYRHIRCPYNLQVLVRATLRTLEIDESGDASLDSFLEERRARPMNDSILLKDFLEEFLVWANGPDWESFLATAKVGDVPPKGQE
jgi:hypothetical protein